MLLSLTVMVGSKDAQSLDAELINGPTRPNKPVTLVSVDDVLTQSTGVWSAFKGGKYREGIAGIIMVVVFIWRRFGSKFIIGKLSPWWVGFITVLCGYVGTIPEALSSDVFSWGQFFWAGLLTSGEAMLFWQTLGKKVLPKLFGESKT